MKGRQEGPQERRRQGRAAQGYNPDRRYQDRRDDCQRGRAAPGPHRPVAIRLTGIAAGIGRPMATPRPRSRLARYGHYPLVESTQGISAAKRTSARAGLMAAMRDGADIYSRRNCSCSIASRMRQISCRDAGDFSEAVVERRDRVRTSIRPFAALCMELDGVDSPDVCCSSECEVRTRRFLRKTSYCASMSSWY